MPEQIKDLQKPSGDTVQVEIALSASKVRMRCRVLRHRLRGFQVWASARGLERRRQNAETENVTVTNLVMWVGHRARGAPAVVKLFWAVDCLVRRCQVVPVRASTPWVGQPSKIGARGAGLGGRHSPLGEKSEARSVSRIFLNESRIGRQEVSDPELADSVGER